MHFVINLSRGNDCVKMQFMVNIQYNMEFYVIGGYLDKAKTSFFDGIILGKFR